MPTGLKVHNNAKPKEIQVGVKTQQSTDIIPDGVKPPEKPPGYKFTDRIFKGLTPDSPMNKKSFVPFLSKKTSGMTEIKKHLGTILSSDMTPKHQNDT